jgi:hypothetical protein
MSSERPPLDEPTGPADGQPRVLDGPPVAKFDVNPNEPPGTNAPQVGTDGIRIAGGAEPKEDPVNDRSGRVPNTPSKKGAPAGPSASGPTLRTD